MDKRAISEDGLMALKNSLKVVNKRKIKINTMKKDNNWKVKIIKIKIKTKSRMNKNNYNSHMTNSMKLTYLHQNKNNRTKTTKLINNKIKTKDKRIKTIK